MDEDVASQLSAYLSCKAYPLEFTKDDKRRLREKSKGFIMNDGILMHTGSRGTPLPVIVSATEKLRLIENLHTDAVGGAHFGQSATIKKISDRFWWPTVTNDIREFIRACESCQGAKTNMNANNRPVAATLNPIYEVQNVFDRWGLDVIGPLNETGRGMKYILVATEYLTKWAEVKAVADRSAESVHAFLMELVFRYGAPNVILHDQGREFNNGLVEDLCKKMKIEVATTAYHPQINKYDLEHKFCCISLQ